MGKRLFFLFRDFLRRRGGFLFLRVLVGLTPAKSGRPYPPPPALSGSSRNRWTVPDGTRSRECKLSTLCKHILTVSTWTVKWTQQNKYLVAFNAIKACAEIQYLLKMFWFLRVLRCFRVLVSWTRRMYLCCRHLCYYVRIQNTAKPEP